MLGKLSVALHQAADVLAPPPPLFEDFVYYWKKLMGHYLDVSKSKPVPIELTNIPNHFDHLLQILLKEEEDKEGEGSVGPCLEYLMQHNLLDLLASLAASDDPPGMRQHVLQFVTKLLNQAKSIVLGHPSVYSPLQRLVGLCDGSTPTATESYEIQFLLSVTGLLRRNHHLISVFIANSEDERRDGRGREGRTSESSSSCSGSTCGSESSVSPKNALFTTPLIHSARASGVSLIPQPPEEKQESKPQPHQSHTLHFPLADSVLSYIDSPDTRVRLKGCQALMLLSSLPPDCQAGPLLANEASLRLVSRLVLLYYTIPHTTDPTHIDDMHLSWGLDIPSNDCLTCTGCRHAATFLAWFDYCDKVMIEGSPVIADTLARRLSDSFLGEVFTEQTLKKPVTLTLLTKCFKMATSAYLNNVLYDWLICDTVLPKLLENWKSKETELTIETLRFFEVVLEKGCDFVLHSLVLKYLHDRSYLNIAQPPEENDNVLENDTKIPKEDITRIIERWTSVVPKETQSCTCGYEEYLSESMRQYLAVVAKAGDFPPLASIPTPGDQFTEGPFLSTLLDALSAIPKQPYEVNLELTGLVSRLALRPEPELSEYLLTLVTRKEAGARCLHSVLTKVSQELSSLVQGQPGFSDVLKEVRADLLGRSSSQEKLRNEPNISMFESIVVVEELCKELAAIAHVKMKTSTS